MNTQKLNSPETEPKPAWWLLYLVPLALLVGLALAQVRIHSHGALEFVQFTFVALAMGCMKIWLNKNAMAIAFEEMKRLGGEVSPSRTQTTANVVVLSGIEPAYAESADSRKDLSSCAH